MYNFIGTPLNHFALVVVKGPELRRGGKSSFLGSVCIYCEDD